MARPGNLTELWIELINAFGGARPTSFGQTELWEALINAVSAFTPTTGNTGWTAYPFTFGPAYASNATNGQFLYRSTSGDLLEDFFPSILTPLNGLSPQMDLNAGTSVGFLASQGYSPIPLWVADVVPGSNAGYLVNGTPAGPRGAPSYQAAVTTGPFTNAPPANRVPIVVEAGSFVNLTISQDGSSLSPLPATLTGTSPMTVPLTVYSDSSHSTQNNQFQYIVTSPNNGTTTYSFTVAGSPTGITYSNAPAICAAVAAASNGTITFSTLATVTNTGGGSPEIVITDLGGGAAGNGNQFSTGTNDITAALGVTAPGLLEGGQGGDSQSAQGAGILYVKSSTPA